MCQYKDEDLLLFHYQESPNQAEIQVHLSECDACQQALKSLQELLSDVDELEVPRRSESYTTQLWWRIKPRLKASPNRSKTWLPLLAAAAILVAAFLAGRMSVQSPEQSQEASLQLDQTAKDRILLASVADHLERTRGYLVDLRLPGETGNKQLVRRLVDDNRFYLAAARQGNQGDLVSFLEELEFTLLDLAHFGDVSMDVKTGQNGEHKQVILKIDLYESVVRDRQKQTQPKQDLKI